MRIDLDRDEKNRILSIVGIWSKDQISFQRFREIQAASGVPARLVETVFWLEDTLDVLQDDEHLFLKGGTAVQCFIPSAEQRASVDLDMNGNISNPTALKDHFLKKNKKLASTGRTCYVRDIAFGGFHFDFYDDHTGTMSFRRRMPSRFGEFEIVKDKRIMSKSIRVQINIKNHWMPAMESVLKVPNFFINDHEKPKTEIQTRMESPADLFADKILATCNVGGFGRERFKDIYDLLVMRDSILNGNEEKVVRKLELVIKKNNMELSSILKGSARTVSSFSNRLEEVKGFSSMVCHGGKERLKDWESECECLADKIISLSNS